MDDRAIRLLVVEDDKVDQMALKRFLVQSPERYDFRFAGSVAEAREILNDNSFDIVVTDYNLGDGTGLDIFNCVHDTPIIVVTGGGDEEVAVTAMKSGAYDYLIKDVDRNYIKVFPVTVNNVLARRKAEELLRKQEKLQGVIELAGAACHELNQPLQAISGYSELMMLEMDESDPCREMAEMIKIEIDRLASITRKLNGITRYETLEYVEGRNIIDINKASD